MDDAKFMNTCSLTTKFKKISVCYKVYVERTICFFGELRETSSSSSSS